MYSRTASYISQSIGAFSRTFTQAGRAWKSTSSARRRMVSVASKRGCVGTVLSAPSLILFPSNARTRTDDADEQMYSNPVLDTTSLANTTIMSPTELKESFDAFLSTIEPLICDTQLNVGTSSIPHPAKLAKGGEDAYFLSSDMQVVGIADGVGGWADVGVDPAEYANKLMEGGKMSAEGTLFNRDPVRIMSDAYTYASRVQGSATCCVLVLDGLRLYSANLGDSGFIVLRGREVVYRSREQQHSFNFPYQIGTGSADRPENSERLTINVQPGDIVIAGTDGLWDNLYDREIIDLVDRSDADPALLAQLVARQARNIANSKHIISPFSKSARRNGYPLACGGKLDDITVIVARIVLNAPSEEPEYDPPSPQYSDVEEPEICDLGTGNYPMMIAA